MASVQQNQNNQTVFRFVLYASMIMLISSVIFGTYSTYDEWQKTGKFVVGESFSKKEIPYKHFAKLVTWLYFASVIAWFCKNKMGWQKRAIKNSWKLPILQLTALTCVILCLWMVMYAFLMLQTQMSSGFRSGAMPDIDGLVFEFPDKNTLWNVTFTAKVSLAGLIISAHAMHLLTKKT
jgi:hypothetical protein